MTPPADMRTIRITPTKGIFTAEYVKMCSKLYNNFKTVFFLGTLTALILFAGQLIGGRTGLVVALGFAVITNFAAYFFSDKIALRFMGAQQVGPDHELYQITEKLAQKAGLPMPRVYVAPHDAPQRLRHRPQSAARSRFAPPQACCNCLTAMKSQA